jgi:hypothetical protein
MAEVVVEIAQIIGAVFVLVAFAALQAGRWRPDGWLYLVANVVGSGTLAVVAAFGGDPGFLLLEGVWSLVTVWSLVGKVRGKRVAVTQ